MSDIHSGVGDVRCEMCAADDVLTMRWSQYVTLCDKHRNATSIATAVHSALHSAEREVLEACVRWVLASDERVEESTRMALLNVGMRYRALLDGKEAK